MYEPALCGFGFKVHTEIIFFTSNRRHMVRVTLWGKLGDEMLKKIPDHYQKLHHNPDFDE